LSKIFRLPVCGIVSIGLNVTDALQLLPGARAFAQLDLMTNTDGEAVSIATVTLRPLLPFLLEFFIVTARGLLVRPTAVLLPNEIAPGLILSLTGIGVGVGVALAVAVEVLVAVAVGVVVGVAVAVEVGLPPVAVGVLVAVAVVVVVGVAVAVGVTTPVEVGVKVGVGETVGDGTASGWSYSSTRLSPLSTT
jgi:hypothetical protein